MSQRSGRELEKTIYTIRAGSANEEAYASENVFGSPTGSHYTEQGSWLCVSSI